MKSPLQQVSLPVDVLTKTGVKPKPAAAWKRETETFEEEYIVLVSVGMKTLQVTQLTYAALSCY